MKENSYQLLKELYVRYYQGAGEVLDDAIELAIQIYCEVNNIQRAAYNNYYQSIKELLWDRFPNGIGSKEWPLFRVALEKFLDDMNYALNKSKD